MIEFYPFLNKRMMPLRKQKDSQFGQEERRIFPLGKIRLAQQFRGKLRKKVIKLFGTF